MMNDCKTCKYFVKCNGYSYCNYESNMFINGNHMSDNCYKPIDYEVKRIYEEYVKDIRDYNVY